MALAALLAAQSASVPPRVVPPEVVTTYEAALSAMRERGACIMRTGTTDREELHSLVCRLPQLLLGKHLVAAGKAVEVTANSQQPNGIEAAEAFVPHTDGHAYGDHYPDVFLLCCEQPAAQGGSNYVVDGYALIERLQADEDYAWVAQALAEIPVDQSSRVTCVSPVVQRTAAGRLMLRARLNGPPRGAVRMVQRPVADAPPAERARAEAMLREYHARIAAASADAPRFVLRSGDVLVVDNYRMFHGRDPFADEEGSERRMWRLWCWSDGCKGVPPYDGLTSHPLDVKLTRS